MGRPRTWTDAGLVEAVGASTSMSEVVRRLRLAHGGAAFVTVRTRIEQLGLDTTHFGAVSTSSSGRRATVSDVRRRWSDQDLAGAVLAASSLNEVFTILGLRVGGGQWQVLRGRIVALGLTTDHWTRPLRAPRSSSTRHLKELLLASDLECLARESRSRADLLRQVGIPPRDAGYRALRQAFAELAIDTRELDGRRGRRRTPLEDLLVKGKRIGDSTRLKERLVEEGVLEWRCALCGLETWWRDPAPLQLDHVNGDRSDNRRQNLRMLCPNCHAQTDTYCGRNVGRRYSSG